jgi:hypothetical protein
LLAVAEEDQITAEAVAREDLEKERILLIPILQINHLYLQLVQL